MTNFKSNLIDIEVRLIHSTEKAWLIESDTTPNPVWLPKSQGELERIPGRSGYYTLTIEENRATEKELI